MKKRILVAYYEMIIGGSTTSLLAFLNCIDKSKYDVDLQLYNNSGALFNDIPKDVNILPEASICKGKAGRLFKAFNLIFSGTFFKARWYNMTAKRPGFSGQVISANKAKNLSRKSEIHYDYAVGFMEGWPNDYISYCVDADKKYAWMHNTYANISRFPELDLPWMRKVDKIVFVADNCTEDFKKAVPQMADKAITVLNITDSSLIKVRAEIDASDDSEYRRFRDASCFKIITACRISMYHKGLDRAVSCAKRLKDAGKDFLWMMVGGGEQLDDLNAMTKEAGVQDLVIPVGNRMNPLPFIKEADIFCMFSRYEGKPMVITESMILGVPVLVTEYLSAHEQIQNGVDGVIVPNVDDCGFEELLYYIEHPEELSKMREYLETCEYGNSEYMREIEKELFL